MPSIHSIPCCSELIPSMWGLGCSVGIEDGNRLTSIEFILHRIRSAGTLMNHFMSYSPLRSSLHHSSPPRSSSLENINIYSGNMGGRWHVGWCLYHRTKLNSSQTRFRLGNCCRCSLAIGSGLSRLLPLRSLMLQAHDYYSTSWRKTPFCSFHPASFLSATTSSGRNLPCHQGQSTHAPQVGEYVALPRPIPPPTAADSRKEFTPRCSKTCTTRSCTSPMPNPPDPKPIRPHQAA